VREDFYQNEPEVSKFIVIYEGVAIDSIL
jgi:hypothetical protein